MLTLDFVKNKSSAKLQGLHPVVLTATFKLIEMSFAKGVPIVITQGYRSVMEQDALYAQGRTKPGKIVTNARGGRSLHNYGVAIDFALLLPDGKQVSWDMLRDGNANGRRDWDEAVEIAKKLGFEWGGDWKSFVDTPHFQMTFGLTLNDYAAGKRPSAKQVEDAMLRIQPKDNAGEKEDNKLELSKYQRDTLVTALQALLDRKIITDKSWVDKAKNGTLMLTELTWLNTILVANK